MAPENHQLNSTFAHNGFDIKYSYITPAHSTSPLIPIVFVHGTPWSSIVFQPLARSLLAQGKYKIVLYDLPGYGQSQTYHSLTASEPDVTVKAQSLALTALLSHIGIGSEGSLPHVVAHDIAGVIALRAHLIHGADFASLCLLDTNTVLPWGDGVYTLIRDNAPVFEALSPIVFEGTLRGVIHSARVNSHGLAGEEWEDLLAEPWLDEKSGSKARQTAFVRQIKQADDADTKEVMPLYGEVRCDVKLIWGEQDSWIPGEKMGRLRAMLGIRAKEFVTVPDAGHLVMFDQPERVALEVGLWLEKQSRS